MRRNALLPRFNRSGGPGKERRSGESKRGRRKLNQVNGAGVNVTHEARKLFRLGIKTFYANPDDTVKRTLREAYDCTIQRYFSHDGKLIDGVWTKVTPPAGDVPTYEQFRYWFSKDTDADRVLQIRTGRRRYDLQYRGLGGDASAVAFGPGSVYQIDSTKADVYLVSAIDRKRIIGRPTLYFIIDVFTRMITGFCAVIEPSSYASGRLALENAAQSKVDYCKGFGITISEEEWPAMHLPEVLVADRAEFLGEKSNHLVDAFGFQITNTPPYRADLKAFVERLHLSVREKLIRQMPGVVLKPHERGEADYRLDAALNFRDFRKALIYFILHHNRSRIEKFRPKQFMLTDRVEPRPIELWKWGVENRSGHLLRHDPEFVKMNLLPSEKATLTERGIRFKNLYYTCERAVTEHWFATARQERSSRIDIAYDPRSTANIYLRLPKQGGHERCQLMAACSEFAECSWEDMADYFTATKGMKEESRTNDIQNGALYNAQVGGVVETAKDLTTAALNGESKASRISGIRDNARLEREIERRAALGDVTADPTPAPGKPLPSPEGPAASETDGGYVGVPTDFETLEQQREELCKSK